MVEITHNAGGSSILGGKDSLEWEMTTYSCILAWKFSREAWQATVLGVARAGCD